MLFVGRIDRSSKLDLVKGSSQVSFDVIELLYLLQILFLVKMAIEERKIKKSKLTVRSRPTKHLHIPL